MFNGSWGSPETQTYSSSFKKLTLTFKLSSEMKEILSSYRIRESKNAIILALLILGSVLGNQSLVRSKSMMYMETILAKITEASNQENKLQNRPSYCKRSVKLGEIGQFKITLLASFPGSGNTWSRILIENVSGYFTGSVFNETKLCKCYYA